MADQDKSLLSPYLNSVTDADFALFAGKRAKEFESSRQAMLSGRFKPSISLVGALFFPFYASYYKQWLLALVFMVGLYGADLAYKNHLPAIVSIVTSLFMATIFKSLYVYKAYKKIAQIKHSASSPEEVKRQIEKAGGVTWLGAFLVPLPIIALYVTLLINLGYFPPQ